MDIGGNIKRLRKDRNIKQSEIADLIGMHRSNYSKIENGQREISLAAVDKIADFFNVSIDELIHMGQDIPKEIILEDKTTVEQVKLIQELDQEGIGQLVEMGVNKGRSARADLKVGICGEHGGEPNSVKFCHRVGLNYVSCSPFRVPIARLAAAQAAIETPRAAKKGRSKKRK